jgi:hypothetical protein
VRERAKPHNCGLAPVVVSGNRLAGRRCWPIGQLQFPKVPGWHEHLERIGGNDDGKFVAMNVKFGMWVVGNWSNNPHHGLAYDSYPGLPLNVWKRPITPANGSDRDTHSWQVLYPNQTLCVSLPRLISFSFAGHETLQGYIANRDYSLAVWSPGPIRGSLHELCHV